MHIFSRTALTGSVVEKNLPPVLKDRSLGTLHGMCGNVSCELSLAEILKRHTFFEGSPRSGKSNAIKLTLSALEHHLGPDSFVIVFDPRGDYLQEFYRKERGDMIISTLPRHKNVTQGWNVFAEILSVDPYNRELFIREIANRLVKENDPRQKYFSDGARNLICGVIDQFMCMNQYSANNRTLRDILCSPVLPDGRRHPLLCFKDNPQHSHLDSYYTNPNFRAAFDFRSFAKNAAENHFIGNAFGGTGKFAIGDFVRQKGGRFLFLEYDESCGETLATMIGLLLDLAMMTMMSNETSTGSGYFVLDELHLIECREIEKAAAFMNGQNGCILAATQSHSGLYERYGEHKADSIISSFSSFFFFPCNDSVSRQYVKALCGTTDVETLTTSGYSFRKEISPQNTVNDDALNRLRVGEAIVRIPDGDRYYPPFIFRFEKYQKRKG